MSKKKDTEAGANFFVIILHFSQGLLFLKNFPLNLHQLKRFQHFKPFFKFDNLPPAKKILINL